MMTKAEELKALAKIKKILDEAGENSYIGMAFAGCVQIAESNIEYDFGENPQETIKNLERKLDNAKEDAKNWKEAYNALVKTRDIEKEAHQAQLQEMQERIAKLRHEKHEAISDMNDERKDVTIVLADGEKVVTSFARIQYFDNDGFRFINVVEKSGWTTSYKLDNIKDLIIE